MRRFANLDRYDNLDTESLAFMAGILDAAGAGAGDAHARGLVRMTEGLGVRYAESNVTTTP